MKKLLVEAISVLRRLSNFKIFKTDKLYIGLLLLFAIVSHIEWFSPYSTLFHADWLRWTDDAASQAWWSIGSWSSLSGLGSPNPQVGFYLIAGLWSLITLLTGSFDVAVKIVVLIPIAFFGFLTPYYLGKHLTNYRSIAFVVAAFYGSTTYFLSRQVAHLPIAFVYAISPLIILLFIRALLSMRSKDWIYFSLIYALGLCLEVRIMFILTFILLLFGAVFFPWKKHLNRLPIILLITGSIIAGLSAYWLLPTLFGGATTSIQEITSRSLFGNHLFDLQHALSISSSSWTGGLPNEDFITQPVKIYLWLIPIFILTPLVFIKKLQPVHRKFAIYFLIIAVIGIFLTKQSSSPGPFVYSWLYNNIPGFSLFREASKFYQLIAWGYLGLMALGLLIVRRSNPVFFGFISIMILTTCVINLSPLISGKFGTMFVAREMPADYEKLTDFLKKDNGYYRTLWLPKESQWAYFDASNPRVGAVSLAAKEWRQLVGDTRNPTNIKLSDMMKNPLTNQLADNSSIKYIIVPIRDEESEDNFIKHYGNDTQYFIDTLDDLAWLQKIDIGTNKLALYENDNYKDHFYTSNTTIGYNSRLEFDKGIQAPIREVLSSNSAVINTGSDDNFVTADELFQESRTESIKLRKDKIYSLYSNTSSPTVTYLVNNNTLSIRKGDAVTPQFSQLNLPNHQIAGNMNFDISSSEYILAKDNLIIHINPDEKSERKLGVVNDELALYSVNSANIIDNPTFRNGLWENRVQDCNNYDNNPLIWMQLGEHPIREEDKSVKLIAQKHTACTGPEVIPVTPGEYLFEFNYKGNNSEAAGYSIEFNDANNTRINKRFSTSNNKWKGHSVKINVPDGADKLILKVNAYDQVKGSTSRPQAELQYTDFRMSRLTKASEITSKKQNFDPVKLIGVQNFSVSNSNADYSKSNKMTNGSFENKLWSKNVEDCNDNDDKPDIGMRLSNNASNGKKSLQLEAKRHIACTSTKIPVTEGSLYEFSFDYQSSNSNQAGYYISFNDHSGKSISEKLVINDNNWNSYRKTIEAPYGANTLTLVVYAYSGLSGRENKIVRYDNFSLKNIPDLEGRFFLVGKPKETSSNPKSINIRSVNPTKYEVEIKKAKAPFYLNMSETFNPRWRLGLNSPKDAGLKSLLTSNKAAQIADKNHFISSGYLNGWYVNPLELCKNNELGCRKNIDGTFDLRLVADYVPQRWFYVGVFISVLTLVGLLTFLTVSRFRILRKTGAKD